MRKSDEKECCLRREALWLERAPPEGVDLHQVRWWLYGLMARVLPADGFVAQDVALEGEAMIQVRGLLISLFEQNLSPI